MPKIFLCYRRSDSWEVADRVFDRLVGHYGARQIFMDTEAIRPGVDFQARIPKAVMTSDVFLALVGTKWLARRRNGRSRLHDKNDQLRIEIEIALSNGVRIIPLLWGGAGMPKERDLPSSIRKFANLQALDLTSLENRGSFRLQMKRLIKTLDIVGEQNRRRRRVKSQSSRLVVAWSPYPPLVVATVEGRPSGPLPDLMSCVASDFGRTIAWRKWSIAEVLSTAENAVDVILCVFKTSRRERHYKFSYATHAIGLQGICRSSVVGAEMHQRLYNGEFRIAVNEGEIGWEFVEDQLQSLIKEKRVTVMNAFEAKDVGALVRAGVCDIALVDELSCVNYLQQFNTDGELQLAFSSPLDVYELCFAIHKESTVSISQFNNSMAKHRMSVRFRAEETEAITGYEEVIQLRGLLGNVQGVGHTKPSVAPNAVSDRKRLRRQS
jgi:hypothetical protein